MNFRQSDNGFSPEQSELVISLKDLFASLLLRWKTILVFLLIFALLGYGYTIFAGSRSEGVITDEDIQNARILLPNDKAADVEKLFFQYVAYQDYQRQLKEYYSRFVSGSLDASNVTQIRAKYLVTSNVEGLDNLLTTLALTEADYDALREISPDEEAGSLIYSRVSISAVSNDRITVTNASNASSTPICYLFTLTAIGNSEQQCAEMMTVMETAFKREIDSLRTLDSDLNYMYSGCDYNHNMDTYIQNLQKSNIDRMTAAEKEMTDLTNKISKLSVTERNYYNLLLSQNEQEYQPESHISWKKWTVLGAVLGAFFAVGICGLQYLFDGRVKIPEEAQALFNSTILQRACFPGKKNLFSHWAFRLTGADKIPVGEKADLIAADLQLMGQKAGFRRLFLVCDSSDSYACQIAEQVESRLSQRSSELEVLLGNPSNSVMELERFSSADAAVVITELKHSSRKALKVWSELCARHQIPVAGMITAEKCW